MGRGQHPRDDRLDVELLELERTMRPHLTPYPVKEPTLQESRRLVQHLLERAGRQERFADPGRAPRRAPSLGQFIRLQMETYGWGFWTVSLAFFVLLTLAATQVSPGSGQPSVNLYALILPGYVVAAAVYGQVSRDRGMRLVENTVPFPPALLWLVRTLMVMGLNIGLGLVGTVSLALSVHGLTPFLFLVHWLSAVFATGGMTAWVLFHRGVRPAVAAGIGMWAISTAIQQPAVWGGAVSAWANALLLLAGLASMAEAGRRGYLMWRIGAGVLGVAGESSQSRG